MASFILCKHLKKKLDATASEIWPTSISHLTPTRVKSCDWSGSVSTFGSSWDRCASSSEFGSTLIVSVLHCKTNHHTSGSKKTEVKFSSTESGSPRYTHHAFVSQFQYDHASSFLTYFCKIHEETKHQ